MSKENEKLRTLLIIEGLTEETAIESCMMDSTLPGICMNDGCDYTTFVEPDQDEGWCEVCNTQSVKSLELLML